MKPAAAPRSWRSRLIAGATHALALTWLYPYLWMLTASLKPTAEIYTTSLLGGSWSLDNFRFLFDSTERLDRPFVGALFNSFLVTGIVTASVLLSSVYTAFAIILKSECRGHRQLTEFLLFKDGWPFMLLNPAAVRCRCGRWAC